MKYKTIEALREHYPLSALCKILSVSRSGYFSWKARKPSKRALANEQLLQQIRRIHTQSFGAYGSPRIYEVLRQQGHTVSRERVRRLMRQNGIVGRYRRKRCRTTDSNHALPIAPNRLQQDFRCERPNRVWLADISYIPTGEGFLYLAAMKDLCTRKIVGWSMSETIDTQLVLDALSMACLRQQPDAGLIVHSDRGCQYASDAFRKKLEVLQMIQSMSRRGNCYDNAPMESFFASLKTEYLEQHRFATHAQARMAIFQYIETFYNAQRLHSGIGYRTPNQAEAKLKEAA